MEVAALIGAIQGGRRRDDGALAVEALYATAHWLLGQDRIADAAGALRVMLLRAPSDERAWLALGECHERREEYRVALELYGAGSVAAAPSCRCHIARARVFRRLGIADEADAALNEAAGIASGDGELEELVTREKAGA